MIILPRDRRLILALTTFVVSISSTAARDEYRAQTFNDLRATGMRLGILVNFGAQPKLEHHRIVL